MTTLVEMEKNNGRKKTVLAASQVAAENVALADDIIHIGAEKARWERAKMGASPANDELLARLLLDLYFHCFASRIELKNIKVIRLTPQKQLLDEIDADNEDLVINLDKGGEHCGKKNETMALKVENDVKFENASTEGDGISNFILSDTLMNIEKELSNIKSLGPTTTLVESLGPTKTWVGIEPKLFGDVVPHLDHVRKEVDSEEVDGEQLYIDVSCLEERETHKEDSHSMLIVAENDEDGRQDEQLEKVASLPTAGQTRHGKNFKNSQQTNPKRKRVKKQHHFLAEKGHEAELKKMIHKGSSLKVTSDQKKRTAREINSDYVDKNPGSGNCLSDAGIENTEKEKERGKEVSKMKRGRGHPKKLRENITKVLKVRDHQKKKVCKGNRPMAEVAEDWRERYYKYFNVVDGNEKAICCLCRLPVNFQMLTLTKHLKYDHGLVWKDNCLQFLSCDEPGCTESIFHTYRAYLLHKKIVHKQLANSEKPKQVRKAKICSICGQLSNCLREHMKIHSPKVTCPQPGCGRLVKEHLLRKHIMIHSSGVCPYPDCNTKFNSKTRVECHIRTVHRNDQLQCPHCHLTTRRDVLKRHIEEMHDSGITYPCYEPGCGQVFKRQRNCIQHAKLHLKIKPFQCVWCDFTGTQHNNIRSHALTKHRENFSKLKPKLGEKYWHHTDSVSLQNSNDPPEPS